MAVRYIYIIGAGRSGTTVCSLLLQELNGTQLLGELNHLGQFMEGKRPCACGRAPDACALRAELMPVLPDALQWREYTAVAQKAEAHSRFPEYNFRIIVSSIYSQVTSNVVGLFPDRVIIDSGKYVSRALLLNRVLRGHARFVWVTRDPRGVVYSFSKKVQSSRSTLSACFYYLAVNFMVLIASLGPLRGKVIRLRYESIVQDPISSVARLSDFLKLPVSAGNEKRHQLTELARPLHMIGGNRLVADEGVQLRADNEWEVAMSKAKRLFIWIICSPLCVFFGYRI